MIQLLKKQILLIITICLFPLTLLGKEADLIVFSFDRPLQLYSLLESVKTYITGIGEIHVIYRTSDDEFELAYDKLCLEFSDVNFIQQGNQPRQDFKPLTLNSFFNSPNDYILFAVDDIIVKDYVNLEECINALEQYDAYGFYLRLGNHINFSYARNEKNEVPDLKNEGQGMCSWQFIQASGAWKYPNTVDMTVYRKSDIQQNLLEISYSSPNILEGIWHQVCNFSRVKKGLCYKNSKIINIPLNLVQRDWLNRNMNHLTPNQLLEIFNNGLKIDIDPLFQIVNVSPHIEYNPTFILR